MIDTAIDKPISALNGYDRLEGIDFGGDEPMWMETDDGRGYHVIGYTEYLRFHLDCGNIAEHLLAGEDSDRWLTSQGLAQVGEYLKQLLARPRYGLEQALIDSVEVSDQLGGDEPNFSISFAVDSAADMTVGQFIDKVWSAFAATMTNVTDPGTFNHPYLFSEVR